MRRLGLILPVAAVAAVVAFLLRRLRGGSADAPLADAGPQPFTCECGAEYRVSGEGRHRVYWRADASPQDPVMGGRCTECERPLPGEHVSEPEKDPAPSADA